MAGLPVVPMHLISLTNIAQWRSSRRHVTLLLSLEAFSSTLLKCSSPLLMLTTSVDNEITENEHEHDGWQRMHCGQKLFWSKSKIWYFSFWFVLIRDFSYFRNITKPNIIVISCQCPLCTSSLLNQYINLSKSGRSVKLTPTGLGSNLTSEAMKCKWCSADESSMQILSCNPIDKYHLIRQITSFQPKIRAI